MQSSAGLRRLSVHADDVSVDVALPAAVPLETLLPSITHALAKAGAFTVDPVRYELCAPGGVIVDASKTLSENGIRNGTSLTLIRSTVDAPAARFDDAAEAVSAALAAVERRWNRQVSRLVGTLVAGGLAGVSAVVLYRHGGVAVAATIGVAALLAAAVAYRLGDDGAGLTLGVIAIAFAALAAWVAVPGGPGAANAVFGAAAATTSAAIVRVIACHATVFTGLMCCAGTLCLAAAVCVMSAAPLPAVGAGLAAVSLALIEASPSVSIALTRLSPGSVDHQRAIRAHTWLTSLIAAFSVATTLGAIGVLSEPSLPHIAFATMTGGILLLRARARRDIRHSAVSIVCGAIVIGVALVGAAVANPRFALHIASLSMMLSVVALYAGFMTGATTIPSTARRSIDLLQYFALAAVAPLALWLCGLYSAVRGLNLP